MNIILLEKTDWSDNDHVVLRDHRLNHLRAVLKAETGATLKVGLVNGDAGTGQVVRINDNEACLCVTLGQPPRLVTLAISFSHCRGPKCCDAYFARSQKWGSAPCI